MSFRPYTHMTCSSCGWQSICECYRFYRLFAWSSIQILAKVYKFFQALLLGTPRVQLVQSEGLTYQQHEQGGHPRRPGSSPSIRRAPHFYKQVQRWYYGTRRYVQSVYNVYMYMISPFRKTVLRPKCKTWLDGRTSVAFTRVHNYRLVKYV